MSLRNGRRDARYYEEKMTETTKQSTEWSPAEVETTGPETKNGIVVNALNVKIREAPSFDSEVVGLLGRGTLIEILNEENGFYKAKKTTASGEDKTFYICKGFVKEE